MQLLHLLFLPSLKKQMKLILADREQSPCIFASITL